MEPRRSESLLSFLSLRRIHFSFSGPSPRCIPPPSTSPRLSDTRPAMCNSNNTSNDSVLLQENQLYDIIISTVLMVCEHCLSVNRILTYVQCQRKLFQSETWWRGTGWCRGKRGWPWPPGSWSPSVAAVRNHQHGVVAWTNKVLMISKF